MHRTCPNPTRWSPLPRPCPNLDSIDLGRAATKTTYPLLSRSIRTVVYALQAVSFGVSLILFLATVMTAVIPIRSIDSCKPTRDGCRARTYRQRGRGSPRPPSARPRALSETTAGGQRGRDWGLEGRSCAANRWSSALPLPIYAVFASLEPVVRQYHPYQRGLVYLRQGMRADLLPSGMR